MKKIIILFLVFTLCLSSISTLAIERKTYNDPVVLNAETSVTPFVETAEGDSIQDLYKLDGEVTPMVLDVLVIGKLILKALLLAVTIIPVVKESDSYNTIVAWIDANKVKEYGTITEYDRIENKMTVVAIRLYWERINHLVASNARFYNGSLQFANDLYTKKIQHTLNVYALSSTIAEDGNFGPGTKAAVVAFQKQYYLIADGSVGPLTYAELAKAKKY